MRGEDLQALLGPGIVARHSAPDLAHVASLYADERMAIARAVAKRQAEFATARVLARHALSELGIAAQSLPPNADRSPSWPPGIAGSITHTDGLCAVAVAPLAHVRSLGLDAETATPLAENLLPMICTPSERRWLQTQPEAERGAIAKLIFSAKEAFYKCQHPLTKTFLDFLDVEIEFGAPDRFVAIVRRGLEHADPAVLRTQGRYARRDGRVFTTVVLSRDGAAR